MRGHRKHAQVDVRRTMRASLQTGGVPIELKYRPKRPRRPEIFVLCDVSTSVNTLDLLGKSSLLRDTTVVMAEHLKKFDPGEEFGPLRRYRKLVQSDAILSFYRPS